MCRPHLNCFYRTSSNLPDEADDSEEAKDADERQLEPKGQKRAEPGNKFTTASKRSVASAPSAVDAAIMEYLNSRKHHQEDELDAFFKSMASSMRKMPEHTKAKLKFKIHELVHRAEMEAMYEASGSSLGSEFEYTFTYC